MAGTRSPRSVSRTQKTSKHFGGAGVLNCAHASSLLCPRGNNLTKTLLEMQRALKGDSFRDALLSMPVSFLKAVFGISDADLEAGTILQHLTPAFLQYMPRRSDQTSMSTPVSYSLSTPKQFTDEIMCHKQADKMYVYYADDASAISSADCDAVLLKYLQVIDSKLVDPQTLLKLSNFLRSIATRLLSSSGLEENTNESNLLQLRSDIQTEINSNPAFADLTPIKDIDKAFVQYGNKRTNRELGRLSARLVSIAGEVTLHTVIIETMLKRMSICKDKTVLIQSLSNPTVKCPLKPDSNPCQRVIYVLVRTPESLNLVRVLLLAAMDKQVYAFPFSPVDSSSQTNIMLFRDRIKDKLAGANLSSSGRGIQLLDLPYDWSNKPINTDLSTKLPYFEFWDDFAKTVMNFMSSPTTASFVKSQSEVMRTINDYFNFCYLLCICHVVKNYALNHKNITVNESVEATKSVLSECGCFETDPALLRAARAKLDDVVFTRNTSTTVSLVPGAFPGYVVPQAVVDKTTLKDAVQPILASVKYDQFVDFYKIFAKSVSVLVHRLEPQKLSNTSDPVFDMIAAMVSAADSINVDVERDSRTEVLSRLRNTLQNVQSSSLGSVAVNASTSTSSNMPIPMPAIPLDYASLMALRIGGRLLRKKHSNKPKLTRRSKIKSTTHF